MTGSPPSKALREIFREEALAHKNRSETGLGDPLRLSAARLQWSLWALVGLLALLAVAVLGAMHSSPAWSMDLRPSSESSR